MPAPAVVGRPILRADGDAQSAGRRHACRGCGGGHRREACGDPLPGLGVGVHVLGIRIDPACVAREPEAEQQRGPVMRIVGVGADPAVRRGEEGRQRGEPGTRPAVHAEPPLTGVRDRDVVGVEIRHPVDAGQTQGGCRGARDRGACQRGDVRASGERHDAAHGATIRPGRERLTV